MNELGGIGDQGQLELTGCPGLPNDNRLDDPAIVVFIVNRDLQFLD